MAAIVFGMRARITPIATDRGYLSMQRARRRKRRRPSLALGLARYLAQSPDVRPAHHTPGRSLARTRAAYPA